MLRGFDVDPDAVAEEPVFEPAPCWPRGGFIKELEKRHNLNLKWVQRPEYDAETHTYIAHPKSLDHLDMKTLSNMRQLGAPLGYPNEVSIIATGGKLAVKIHPTIPNPGI